MCEHVPAQRETLGGEQFVLDEGLSRWIDVGYSAQWGQHQWGLCPDGCFESAADSPLLCQSGLVPEGALGRAETAGAVVQGVVPDVERVALI